MNQEEKLNDLQMKINTLKMEFGRLDNFMNVMNNRITQLQSVVLEKEKQGQLSPDTIKELKEVKE